LKPGASTWARDTGSRFYRTCAVAALGVAVAGFFLTYLRPMAAGTFEGPSRAHLHGALLTGWLLLVVAQSVLVRKRLAVHRTLGWAAVVLAPSILVTTVLVGAEVARRDMLRSGAAGADTVIGTLTTSLAFLLLVAAALLLRRKAQWHKRLIFLATVVILWPAWFRWRHFLPDMPRPDIWLGLVLTDLPIAIAAVRDRIRFGAVHPAYLTVGLAVIAEQVTEVLLFGTPGWHRAAIAMLEVLP
jgi:hypothetical protein